uniref:Reverse transcriptase domain-containing protein n=1 Tax=Oryzias latipes TaxID=8090 RepID=A0A3P9J789_ORYLA
MKLKTKTSSNSPHPWLNEEIAAFRRTCRQVERLWKSTNLEVHRLHLKEMTGTLNNMIKLARSKYFSDLVHMNKRNPKVVFDTIQNIVSPSAPPVPVYTTDDCNRFLQYFVNKVNELKLNLKSSNENTTIVASLNYSWTNFSAISIDNIMVVSKKMKPSSCPLDILPSSMFFKVIDLIAPFLVKIINLSLSTGTVPNFLKQAAISPILKKPNLDPSQPSNYRPISKLPILSKVLEKIVAEQLTSFLSNNELFDKYQSGFIKMHSTETTLLKVSNDIQMAADSGKYTVLVLLDLSSAFDTVDHKILLGRLENEFGIAGFVLKWFTSYLTNRTFSVYINGVLSDTAPLLYGVPQGSVLGPLLFLMYIYPLGKLLNNFKNVSYHFYADDIQLYCSFNDTELHKLTELLDCLACVKSWLTSNSLQLNSEKTETLIVAPENKIPIISRHLGSLSSSVQPCIRNLGVWFDQSMSLDHHSSLLIRNCFYHLRNIAKLRAFLSNSVLEMVIHAFISSRLDYCKSLFTCFNKSVLNRLQLVQNTAARLLTGSDKRAHITPILSSLHWLPIKWRIDFKILVLTYRALNGQTPKYLSDLLCPYASSRALRSSDQNLLKIFKTKYKTRGDRSFQGIAPRLWNALPLSLRVADTFDSFKSQLKTLLFKNAFS